LRTADVAGDREAPVAQVLEPDLIGEILVLSADQRPAAELAHTVAHDPDVRNPRVVQADALHAGEELGRGDAFDQAMLPRTELVPGLVVFLVVLELVLVVLDHQSPPRRSISYVFRKEGDVHEAP